MKRLALAALVAFGPALPAHAAEEADFRLDTASDLADLCSDPGNSSAIHMCQGYLVGIHHMHQAIDAALGARIYCLPGDGSVTRNTAARDFAAWVTVTPAAGGMPAREGVLQWAQISYPCQ